MIGASPRFLVAALFAAGIVPTVRAGVATTTFEDAGLAPGSYKNAADPAPPGTPIPYERSGFFTHGGNALHNVTGNDGFFPYWTGWSISAATDVNTNGFENQYSAITGSGSEGSATYAVAHTGFSSSYINLAPGASPISFDVTNTTYAGLTMEQGDPYGYTQPFSQALKSFFLLTIAGYSGLDATGSQVGLFEFYLADFRDPDKNKNFILKTWETVVLPSTFSTASSLLFTLTSSDVDPLYGMNTPAYIALDNLKVSIPSAVPEPASLLLCASGLAIGGLAVRGSGGRRFG